MLSKFNGLEEKTEGDYNSHEIYFINGNGECIISIYREYSKEIRIKWFKFGSVLDKYGIDDEEIKSIIFSLLEEILKFDTKKYINYDLEKSIPECKEIENKYKKNIFSNIIL